MDDDDRETILGPAEGAPGTARSVGEGRGPISAVDWVQLRGDIMAAMTTWSLVDPLAMEDKAAALIDNLETAASFLGQTARNLLYELAQRPESDVSPTYERFSALVAAISAVTSPLCAGRAMTPRRNSESTAAGTWYRATCPDCKAPIAWIVFHQDATVVAEELKKHQSDVHGHG